MLITNLDKVVLHMPRCAGSSVRWALMRAGVEYKYSCEHADINSIPEQFRDMERVAFVREPVSWYESWFSYTKLRFDSRKMTPNSVLCFSLSKGFTLSIDGFIKNAVDMESFFTQEHNLKNLKRRIQHVMMNHYLCRYASYWSDISKLLPGDFKGSLYNWYIKMLGIDTATVFRLEDQLYEGMSYIHSGATLRIQNQCNVKHPCSNESMNNIVQADSVYSNRFGYTQ